MPGSMRSSADNAAPAWEAQVSALTAPGCGLRWAGWPGRTQHRLLEALAGPGERVRGDGPGAASLPPLAPSGAA